MSSSQGRKDPETEPRLTRSAAAAAKESKKDEESDDDSRLEHLETTVKALQQQGGALTNEISELKGLLRSLSFQIQAQGSSQGGPSTVRPEPVNQTPIKEAIEKGLASELTKKALSFPESARLQGVSNYEQWQQALRLTLRAYEFENLLEDPEGFSSHTSQVQAMLLLLIRDSLSPQIANTISWIETPEEAYCYIRRQYSQREDAQRNSLYREFHALKFSAKGNIEGFNSRFNELLSRLTVLRVTIDPKDALNQYLFAVEKAFPLWAERQRSAIRQAFALGLSYDRLNLMYIQSDLAEETRAHKSNSKGQSQGQGHGQSQGQNHNNGQGHSQSQGQGQGRRKGSKRRNQNHPQANSNAGHNHSATKGDMKYGTSNKAENQSHSFYIGSFSLESKSSSSEGESSSGEDSDPFFNKNEPQRRPVRPKQGTKSKAKLPKQRLKRQTDALLYDTGSCTHIINDRKWFVDFDPDRRTLPVLITGGGPVYPQGRGTAVFRVKAEPKKGYFTEIRLQNALYCPNIDVNIVSGQRHYRAGGCLIKETLYGPDTKPCGALNVAKSGFFLEVEGTNPPLVHTFSYLHMLNQASEIRQDKRRLVIELPEKPNIRPQEYADIPETPSTLQRPLEALTESSGDEDQ